MFCVHQRFNRTNQRSQPALSVILFTDGLQKRKMTSLHWTRCRHTSNRLQHSSTCKFRLRILYPSIGYRCERSCFHKFGHCDLGASNGEGSLQWSVVTSWSSDCLRRRLPLQLGRFGGHNFTADVRGSTTIWSRRYDPTKQAARQRRKIMSRSRKTREQPGL